MNPDHNHHPAALRPPLGPDACFETHRGRVYRWAAAHGLTHHQRLDVVQECFAKLIEAEPRFPSEASQIAWLRRVASNISIDMIRARRVLPMPGAGPASDAGPLDADPLAADEDARALARALPALSPMQREVLLAKCIDDRTFAQIASELSIAIPTAKTHFLRALEALRASLGASSSAGRSA